jgi:hypothetical protein
MKFLVHILPFLLFDPSRQNGIVATTKAQETSNETVPEVNDRVILVHKLHVTTTNEELRCTSTHS